MQDNQSSAGVAGNFDNVVPKHGLGTGFEKPMRLPLVLSTKSRIYGDSAPLALEPTDKRFKSELKPQVLARDGYRCAFCGFHSDQNDVHHLSDNHQDASLENMRAADRLCHSWSHLGEIADGEAVLAYVPGLSAQDVNHLQRTIMIALEHGDDKARADAKKLLNWLASHQDYTKYAWGTSSPKVFANALVRDSAADRSIRELVFQGLAVVFNPGPLKIQVEAWAKAYRVSAPTSSWGQVYHSVVHATE
jgi:intracellular multiplication protein IcmJ